MRKRVILVPTSLRPLLLYLVHDECGHTSAPYTLRRLQEYWFWPGMATDADNFCKSCDICARSKPPHRYTKLPLETMSPAAHEFGDRIHIDLLNMPRSSDGHVAICTAVDAATGFIFALPCLDKTSSSVVKLLQHTIIPHFGCPKTIVTDLGVENKNSEVEQLLASYKIKHITSSRAHPQSNGMVERRQRMLLNYARLYSDTFSNQNLWHLRIPMCQLILNSTYSASRKFSPFFLTFFRHARLPYHALLNQSFNYNEHSTIAQQLNFSRRILREAEENLYKRFLSAKAEFDKSAREETFPVGSKVFVRTSDRGRISFKLAAQWKGPYVCIAHLPNNNLLLKPMNGRRMEKVHKNLCKLLPFRAQHLRLSLIHI